jgi:hypothetical protein
VRGGYVIQNGSAPELQGQYFYADFPESAVVMTSSLEDLLTAKTKLADGESPSLLAPAEVGTVGILFDSDNNPATPSVSMSLADVFRAGPDYDGSGRMDVVFGQGYDGELYILNKRNGWIYLATNTVPTAPSPGDYNSDGVVDAADYTIWHDTLGSTSDLRANGDNTGASTGLVDQADYQIWKSYFGTSFGTGSVVVPEPACWLLSLMAVAALSHFAHCRLW